MRVIVVTIVVALVSIASKPGLAAPAPDLWAFWDQADETNTASIDHSRWGRLLEVYLHEGADGVNRVAYDRLRQIDRANLRTYLGEQSAIDPRDYARDEQLAYWINLYNALTLEVVLDYPRKGSILRMSKRFFAIGPWDDEVTTIAEQAITLNDIEHRILRPIWRDHRVHYAVNCASLGCPNLQTEAFTRANTERLLANGERSYVNHPRGVRIDDRGRLFISRIYDWYRDDFAKDDQVLLSYLSQHHLRFADALRTYEGRIRYEYDWALNEADKKLAER